MADKNERGPGVAFFPHPGCVAELKEGSLKMFCSACGQVVTVRLPCEVGRLTLKSRDFLNYHRWCTESILKPA